MVDNTPPGSNNSIVHPEMELSDGNDTKRDKRETFGNFGSLSNQGLTALISGNNNINTLGSIELSKMFPTPPSLEQHTNSSPVGVSGNTSDNLMETNEMSIANARLENYLNLGSPVEEPIDDYSYVFIPPKIAPLCGSSKYAPLTNLLSQSSSAITLPPNSSYVPTYVKKKQEQEEARKKQKLEQEKVDPTKKITVPPALSSADNLIPPMEIKKEIKTEAMSPMTKPIPMTSPFGGPRSVKTENSNSIINRLLCSPSPASLNKNQVITPIASPLVANLQGNLNSPYGQDALFRNQRLPIPLHPPPPYDAAVNSPSLNTNLHGGNNDDISNNNKKLISNKNLYNRHSQQMGQKAPEANSLLVNILLYDTSLNIFRDHNFDSCTICVCNATAKSVGNIRGLDSGIYLSLAASCHFNENSKAIIEKSCEGKFNTCSKRDQCGSVKYFGNNRNLMNQSTNESLKAITNFSSIDDSLSPAASSNDDNQLQNFNVVDLMLNGYQDDDPVICRCGFSSVVNRRLAHQTGLFYEDEMEITGIAKDPSCYKKRSLLSYLLKENKKLTQGDEGDNNIKGPNTNNIINKQDNSNKEKDEFALTQLGPIFDLLRSQCTLLQNSSNSIQRAIKHLNQERYSPILTNKHVNILEFIDAFDIVTLALEQGRFAFEKFDGYNNRIAYLPNQPQKKYSEKRISTSQAISVHKWPFINAAGPKSNQDIIRVMKSMKVLLQKAFNQNGTTGLWDAPYAVKGPLTWREFHRLAGRGIGQCEPQPIPSIVVGHDKEWLCISPYALQFWDKLLLEPYSQPKDIAYIVITPDNSFITSKVKTFFKELSTTYEMCRLGRHQPVKRWEGILRVGKTVVSNNNNSLDDDWLQTVDTNKLNELLRLYGHTLQEQLAPFLSKASQDKSLLFPETKEHHSHHSRSASSMPSPMRPPHTPESHSNNNGNNSSSSERGPNTPKSDLDDTKDNLNTSGGNMSDTLGHQYEVNGNPPHIVIYIIEPFTSGTDSTSLERVACLSLLKYYSNLLNAIPDSIKTNISVQIVAQESILELGKSRDINRWSDHMRNFALNVFTQSHRYLAHTHNVKSLTGFGTAANGDLFIKSKDEKNRAPVKLYTPPYILSTRNAKSENNENFGQSGIEQQCSSIMYCCYCLSEDQSMLLAVVTDERGEILENCTINIDVPNRRRRKKTSARRIGLQKLMDFILGVMSQTVKPWRLVIGRIGRIGHGELKGWSWLLSRSNLIKASKHLKDICKQCSYMYPQSVPSIWSACLVTLEPDSNFRVMADQFTPDERFSQRSTQSPLSTPQDVTCTHILVFPTSAILQVSELAIFIVYKNEDDDDDDDDFYLFCYFFTFFSHSHRKLLFMNNILRVLLTLAKIFSFLAKETMSMRSSMEYHIYLTIGMKVSLIFTIYYFFIYFFILFTILFMNEICFCFRCCWWITTRESNKRFTS
jgi:mediator of RNA polymerase II transcription subunit 13